MDSLKNEFKYYKANQHELVKQYRGKFIVIVDDSVIGSYDGRDEAIEESLKSHELGSFLVQYVDDGKDNITQTFHSRVIVHG